MRNPAWLGAAFLLALGAPASAAPITIVTPQTTLTIDGSVEKGELWISAADLSRVNGFELKPQGVCFGEDVCVPLPAEEGLWVRKTTSGARFNLSAFAATVNQVVASDAKHTVWSFGEVSLSSGSKLGKAPDFALQDVNGKTVRLSDFRGKKVLLWVWASW